MIYEIWLGDHYSHFDHGVAHLDDGQDIKLKGLIHNASYCADSILICHEEDWSHLRWFIHADSLDFYKVYKDTPMVILHNKSKKTLKIDRLTTLAPGESMEADLHPERVLKWKLPIATEEEIEVIQPTLGH